MQHEVLALIVDTVASRVAIELNYHDTKQATGVTTILHDSTHLLFDSDGKIQKIQLFQSFHLFLCYHLFRLILKYLYFLKYLKYHLFLLFH